MRTYHITPKRSEPGPTQPLRFYGRGCRVRLLCQWPALFFLFGFFMLVTAAASAQEERLIPHGEAVEAPKAAAEKDDLPEAAPIKRLGQNSLPYDENDPELRRIAADWQRVRTAHDQDAVFAGKLGYMPPHVRDHWRNIIKQMPGMPPDKKLRVINAFFNRMPSRSDEDNYGKEEYWALPQEFLQRGGDCEDFAIAKYMALRHFGWSAEKLWIVLVESKAEKKGHAVLVALLDKRIFVLDNLSRPPHLLIPEEQYAAGYTPLYAFNEHGVWKFTGAQDRRTRLSRERSHKNGTRP